MLGDALAVRAGRVGQDGTGRENALFYIGVGPGGAELLKSETLGGVYPLGVHTAENDVRLSDKLLARPRHVGIGEAAAGSNALEPFLVRGGDGDGDQYVHYKNASLFVFV